MAHLLTLGVQVFLVVTVRLNDQRHLTLDLEAVAIEPSELLGVVGQQPKPAQPDVMEDLRARGVFFFSAGAGDFSLSEW